MAIANARGNKEEYFKFLSTYLHLLKSTYPGTLTDLVTTTDKQGKTQFKFLFLAFEASITGYNFLKKIIVIDETQMKGKYKGCLVAASGQDGNMQVFPLAFGVVDGENEASWVWFFEKLQRVAADENDLVFVSDRHPAIYAAMRKVYPLAHHASCTVHLCRNVKASFKSDGLAAIVSKAARTHTVGDFRYWWTEIEKCSTKCAMYLLNIGLPHWTLSHFAGMPYIVMTSNILESLNSHLTKVVDYPIVSMLESIRAMLMHWFSYRREMAKNAKMRCTREIEKMLIEHLRESMDCAVLATSEWVYQVNDGFGFVFTVDLERKTCTCRVFDVLKVPCCHALAARMVRKFDIYSFIGDCYTVAPLRNLYQQLILPGSKANNVNIPAEVIAVDVNPTHQKMGFWEAEES